MRSCLGLTAAICSILIALIPACRVKAQSDAFCDGFEGGDWNNRWSTYQGHQTPVSTPTHSGRTALEFHGNCHSSIYRTDFSADLGEYSVWVNQKHGIANFSIFIQFATGPDPDPNPVVHTGYEFSLSAANSAGNLFYLRRNINRAYQMLGKGTAKFTLEEWIKVFVRRLPNNTIIAGYQRTNRLPLRDSIICRDPNPITAPGKFLLWACSDVPPYTYFDDACFEPLTSSKSAPPKSATAEASHGESDQSVQVPDEIAYSSPIDRNVSIGMRQILLLFTPLYPSVPAC